MKRYTLLAALTFAATTTLAQMTPVGLWKTIDDKTGQAKSEVRITEKNGVLSARIEKDLNPGADPKAACTECKDERKGLPMVGLEIIRNVRKTEGKDVWEGGKVLDPNNGIEYNARLTPVEGGQKLEMRGFIAFIGRTQTWVRIQ